jgi:aromatase
MSSRGLREVEHEVKVDAPATAVYGLIADVANWPQLFPPTVYVDHVERGGAEERIRIWATANGEAKNWTSRRVLDPAARRIEFRQEVSAPPVAAMGGTWIVEPIAESACRVRLLHSYRAVDDRADHLAWIDQAVDRNSNSELAALKANAELALTSAELLMSFADTVEIAGQASDVYDFLNEAQLWSVRLPHVKRVQLTEDTPGVQILEMDTRAPNGSVHTTKSVRVCFQPHKIVYKQTTLPALMTLHTGYWLIEERAGSLAATSQHTVAINVGQIGNVLGPEATIADAKAFVRRALSGNSRATLGHAKAYAEQRG